MNTTKVGDKFEDKVAKILSDMLESGRLPFKPENCKIFQKKGYNSKARQGEIVFDIAIEVYADGDQDRYLWLILVECKDYTHKVPVDDIEEFETKFRYVSGMGGYATKGLVVTSSAFQEGALNTAESFRIGLGRINEASKFKWILKRSSSAFYNQPPVYTETEIHNKLVKENHKEEHLNFFAKVGGNYTTSIDVALKQLLLEGEDDPTIQNKIKDLSTSFSEETVQVDFIPKEDIISKCNSLLDIVQYDQLETPLFDICDSLQGKEDLEVKFVDDLGEDSAKKKILGKIHFNPDRILILSQQNNYYRKKFTLAHELGHYVLGHGKYLSREYYSEKDFNDDYLQSVSSTDIKWLEWQANYFASHLLIPDKLFIQEFKKAYEKEGLTKKSFGILYVDNQSCNQKSFYNITNRLKRQFQVSRKAIEVRLKQKGILNDQRFSFNNPFSIS